MDIPVHIKADIVATLEEELAPGNDNGGKAEESGQGLDEDEEYTAAAQDEQRVENQGCRVEEIIPPIGCTSTYMGAQIGGVLPACERDQTRLRGFRCVKQFGAFVGAEHLVFQPFCEGIAGDPVLRELTDLNEEETRRLDFFKM